MMRSNSCPRCQGAMEEGFVLTGRDTYRRAAGWVKGQPKKNWLLGLKFSQAPIDIQTWRCGRCGYLESYARG